jgi:glucose-1-phosphate adenylyltransferase
MIRKTRSNRRVLAFVMAGGQGSRLKPLTNDRSKPAVPFGARYRIVDFVLSNLVNSGIRTIYLLVQYRSQSLIEHVRKAWDLSPLLADQFITVVPPQMRRGGMWFQGTADAVSQNINLIHDHRPDLVVVFGADHIYRMDIDQMIDAHLKRDANVSVAALPVPLRQASSFGVIAASEDGRIHGFQEKPEAPQPMPGDPERAYASMGNYVFDAEVLLEALQAAEEHGETDFGGHVLPRLLATHRLYAYDFTTNRVPGLKSYEEPAYWRDVGTLDAFFEAHHDVLGIKPRFDVFNSQWPIYSSNYQGPVARVISGEIRNSLLGAASIVNGARIRNSILRREVVIEPDVEIEDCIIMDYVRVRKGARLRRTIVDRHNVIEAGTHIGHDPDADREHYAVSPGGVSVLALGQRTYFARDSRKRGSGYAE